MFDEADGGDGGWVALAWPSGSIRFDWIGVGDLCIRLRLPCDPVFRREIHTTAGDRACGGSRLTSSRPPDSISSALPCRALALFSVYLFLTFIYSVLGLLFSSVASLFVYFSPFRFAPF